MRSFLSTSLVWALSIVAALATWMSANAGEMDSSTTTSDAAASDRVFLKDGTEIAGTVVEQKDGEYVIVTGEGGGKQTIPWSEVARISLAPGHGAGTKASGEAWAKPAPEVAVQGAPVEMARTTFFSMGLGIGGGSYSGKYENGTDIKGSGLMIVASLQGGFFVTHSLAIGAGGAFLYMPSPKGERTDTKGNVSNNDNVDAAPGGFIGPALRYYVSDGFHLSVVVGYGGLGSSGVFGGTGPAIAPSLGFAIYRNAHFQLGIDGNLYVMPLSSAHESGTFVGGGALLSLAYL